MVAVGAADAGVAPASGVGAGLSSVFVSSDVSISDSDSSLSSLLEESLLLTKVYLAVRQKVSWLIKCYIW